MLRTNGHLKEVSWEEAFGFIADRLRDIRELHGPDSIAFLVSPRCSNEEAYLLQKFARTVIGTNNVDHGTGVYCNSTVPVLLECLGVAASTNSIAELAQSEAILVDEVDLYRKLPTIGGAVLRAKLNGSRLISVGIRRNRIAESADHFLQIRPDTNALLYGAMAKVILDRGLMNSSFIKLFCDDYDSFIASIRDYDLLEAAQACGVDAEQVEAAALTFARARSAAVLYSTVEAHDRATVQSLINLALLTGNLGKPGAGIFALTEQNNLQGVCDMGLFPDRLPGYVPLVHESRRSEFEGLWRSTIPAVPGSGARDVLSDCAGGRVKALWLCRYDPVKTALFGSAQSTLPEFDLVIAQYPFLTDVARFATVVLPTVFFGEEQVTYTSTERRIQLANRVVDPPSGAMPAWRQIVELARHMRADWSYATSADVMKEIASAVPFYSGVSYENLSRDYGRQWPCTTERPLGTSMLFAEENSTFTFAPVPKHILPGPPQDYPYTLVFGHSLYYWNQDALLRRSETLRREYNILLLDYPNGFVEINSDDAKKIGIRDGQQIRLRASRGSVAVTARVTPEIRAGSIFVPYFMNEVEQELLGPGADGTNTVSVLVEKEPIA
jgi:predicted molibdopterin-dependent oxidoreductase YjgC